MANSQVDDTFVLPERARLLYIGPMKTGTTALQSAARDQRQNLLDHGVRYPGTRTNHRTEFGALMGRSTQINRRANTIGPQPPDVDGGGVPAASHWDELKAEIEHETSRRVLVTHEFVSQADDATCQKIVDELGLDRLHVAITLRAPATILPAHWAQIVKSRATIEPVDSWLARLYHPTPDNSMPEAFLRGYDQGELVQRWAHLVGPNNVTVIVVDYSQPEMLTDAFETLLGLPAGMLACEQDTNRSLTAVEAGMFRRVNVALRENTVDWRAFHDLVTQGAITQGALSRTPPPDEPRIRLPAWANEAAQRDGKRFAERIRQSGVRVVGDLDSLGTTLPARAYTEGETVPVDFSVRTLTGTVLAGQNAQHRAEKANKRADEANRKLTATHEKNRKLHTDLETVKKKLHREQNRALYHRVRALTPADRIDKTAAAYTTRELLAALKRRLTYKLRTGKSHPLKPVRSAKT